MQARVQEIISVIERIAPPESAMPGDSCGLKTGFAQAAVSGVLLCIDVTNEVVDQAIEGGFEMIFAHHPLLFTPASTLREDEPQGALLSRLIRARINVYCAHTNFDACPIGTSRALALASGFAQPVQDGFLCAAEDTPISVAALARRIRAAIHSDYVCAYGERIVKRAVFCAGSGNGELERVLALGGDVFVCGELKYHQLCDLIDHGVAVITCGHRESEAPVLLGLVRYLQQDKDLIKYSLRYHIAQQGYVCACNGKGGF